MIAKVIVDVNSKRVDKLFDYLIPDHLEGQIMPGMRVVVPFGPRKVQGYVIEQSETAEFDKLKPILSVQDYVPELTQELIELSEWMSYSHVSKRIAVLDAMLPAALKGKYKKVLKIEDTSEIPEDLIKYFNHGSLILDRAQELEIMPLLAPFIATGAIIEDVDVTQKNKVKKLLGVKLMEGIDFESLTKNEKQLAACEEVLSHREGITFVELESRGISKAVCNTLIKNGVFEKVELEQTRDPFAHKVFFEDTKKVLLEEQQVAFDAIHSAYQNKQAETFLLHGVTGSGKTEVYLQLISEVLNNKQQAIVLVPEIALTPQMVDRFKSRFGDEVAVLHSGLSSGERYDEWRKIKNQTASVSVGARSSIFAPFKDIGIIIIDEEHETTYKQEDYPRYHAREIAEWRAQFHQCPLVLGSATPSLESYARAEKGVYTKLEMLTRANQLAMPDMNVANMRDELANGNRSMFSRSLREKIQEKIDKDEQVVLFLNRRGHAQFMLCRDCGHVPMCPNCDISLTYHKFTDELKCHYCGHKEPPVNVCPSCESEHIREMGVGTQKVEEIIYETFRDAKVIRMDNDTTRKKGAHEKLLEQFKRKEANILLGTQMIAKGLDFPDITLVGVLNADTMLNLPDFRASEKTFQLLTQVSGRAGRSTKRGEVVIQTYNPEHYAVEYALANDYKGFFKEEMEYRRLGKYPPYFYMVYLNFSHQDLRKVLLESKHIHQILLQHLTPGSYVLGPAPSPIARINNQHRFQVMIKFKSEPELLKALNYLDDYYHEQYVKDKFTLHIDINPYMMM
ncbi:primosomal protein N' [Macrococcus animalis]|uniref:primosomal protein N' n=1 Tax=Macrococcus animalis TaxID=3395467 RepID=UPI0039BE2902